MSRKPTTRARGRKPSTEPTKTVPKHLRMTPAQNAAQLAAAQAEALSWSAWIMRAADRAMALEAVARGEAESVPASLMPGYPWVPQ